MTIIFCVDDQFHSHVIGKLNTTGTKVVLRESSLVSGMTVCFCHYNKPSI